MTDKHTGLMVLNIEGFSAPNPGIEIPDNFNDFYKAERERLVEEYKQKIRDLKDRMKVVPRPYQVLKIEKPETQKTFRRVSVSFDGGKLKIEDL